MTLQLVIELNKKNFQVDESKVSKTKWRLIIDV